MSTFCALTQPICGLLCTQAWPAVRGASASAAERIKLFKLIWDAIGTEFGARHELYEINYSGNHEQIRLDILTGAQKSGILAQCRALTEKCMSDYDLDGWKDSTWMWDR